MRYIIVVLCIQELHTQEYGVLSIKSNYGKDYLFYYSEHQTKSINGADVLVEENWQENFEPISVMHNEYAKKKAKTKSKQKNPIKWSNSGNKLIIMNVYALNLKCREKDPDTGDAFYKELENLIKRSNSETILLWQVMKK